MKSLFILLLLILVLSSCKKKENPYQLEDKLYTCIIDYSSAKGIDFKAKTDSIQAFFIEVGILKDSSAKSIIELLEKINKEGNIPEIPHILDSDFINTSLDYKGLEVICTDLDTSLVKTKSSKLNKIQHELSELKDISPKTISQLILNTLTVKDFEHPYYKTQFLITLYNIADTDKGLKEISSQKNLEVEPKN